MSDAPRLRGAIEAVPVDHEGEQYVALRDPAGYTPSVLMLAPALIEVVSLFDGEHSIVDVQGELMRRHGELVTREHLEKLVAALDEHGFLESPAFAVRRASIDDAFLSAPSRPATHAGGAYAGEPAALRAAMDGFFTSPDGPGAIGASVQPGATGASGSGPAVRGLVAPHIDFHRGGPAYAWGYRDLAERGDADLFVIFGTCHAGMADPFALTRKDFDTPLGPARVDREFVDALARRARQDCFASELAHRNEIGRASCRERV